MLLFTVKSDTIGYGNSNKTASDVVFGNFVEAAFDDVTETEATAVDVNQDGVTPWIRGGFGGCHDVDVETVLRKAWILNPISVVGSAGIFEFLALKSLGPFIWRQGTLKRETYRLQPLLFVSPQILALQLGVERRELRGRHLT